MKNNGRAVGLLLLVLLTSVLARASNQNDTNSDTDEDDDETPSASLSLRFSSDGPAHVDFVIAEGPAVPAAIKNDLARTLNCSTDRFAAPPPYRPGLGEYSGWTQEQRDSYEKELVDLSQRSLTADCPTVLLQNSFTREANIDLNNLAADVKRAGAQRLWVNVTLPKAPFTEYSHQFLVSANASPQRSGVSHWTQSFWFLNYRITLGDGVTIPPLHLAYGFRRGDLLRSTLIMAGFILLPLALTLWMRAATLRAASDDPAAAWFSFARTLNWWINGGTLLWIMSGLGGRQLLQDWIRFQSFPGAAAALLDVSVVMGPVFVMYFACLAASYPVHVRLRSSTRTRREYLLQQSVNLGAQAFPLMFFLAALSSVGNYSRSAAVLFLLAYVSWIVCQRLRLRLNKSYPQALTTGELRDRVFDLAKRAGVTVGQIFVLPAGKDQIANAYATRSRVVMFTDYLLQHLTKREVDGVAAHEIAHLQHRHVGKRMLAFYFVVLLPAILSGFLPGLFESPLHILALHNPVVARLTSALEWFWGWSQRDFVTLVAGLIGFYFLSRYQEHVADEGAVLLTGDAEAQITGLLKLSRLNLMPIQWSRTTGAWLTHPSTVKRAERIAAAAGMSAEQLQDILARYDAEKRAGTATVGSLGSDHYSVAIETHAEALRQSARKHHDQQVRFWVALLGHVVPPAMVVLVVRALHWTDTRSWIAYLLGALLTPPLCTFVDVWLNLAARKSRKPHLARLLRLGDLGLDVSRCTAVGFSPGAAPRFFGAHRYDWDVGFLGISKSHVLFVGEQLRFSLSREQIDGICLAAGEPGWWKPLRTYIRWRDDKGRSSIFNLASLEPCSVFQTSAQAKAFGRRLVAWREQTSNSADLIAETSELPALALGQVTSVSPRTFGSLKVNLRVLFYLIPLALILNSVLRLDALTYLLGVILFTRFIESIPYWRFHDQLLSFPANEGSRAAGAGEA